MAGPRPACLVAFLHGFLVPALALERTYWRRLAPLTAELRAAGHEVRFPGAPAVAPVARRAAAVWRRIEPLGPTRVVLVGHSMGGLDARWIAARLDGERRVRAVITLGTPHRGSPLADAALRQRGLFGTLARAIARGGAVHDLCVACADDFNQSVPDRPDVHYAALAAARPAGEMPQWLLGGVTRRLEAVAGPNDSQVPLASQRWGEHVLDVRADHFEMIGWSFARADPTTARPFDHLGALRELIGHAVAL